MQPKTKKNVEKLISKTKIYLGIIALLLIVICILDIKFIIPSILLLALIVYYSYWANNKRKSEISSHIQELILDVDTAAKRTLINSPFPLIIIETNGNVVWKSSKFIKEFINIDINNYLDEIIKEIKQEISEEKEKIIEKEMLIGNKTYKILGEYVKSKQKDKNVEYMMTLYFIDNTEKERLRDMNKNLKTCIGVIMIDNYEEVFPKIGTTEKPQATAAIEKSIYEWASKTGGLVVKTDRDTFVYIFEQRYLKLLKEEKFSILDSIKEIELEGKLPVTLSIAISNEGTSNYEKYKSALSAMDIALGRGGDQAVIRENGKYSFFGGRAQEVEKRTKVKARIVAHALEELILESKDVMIMGHTNGDIDSLGSSLGLYRFVAEMGKKSYIVNNNTGLSLNEFMSELVKEKEYKDIIVDKNEALSKITNETLLIVVDTCKKSYVEVPELLEKTEKIVIIDHHRKSVDSIESPMLSFHEVYASSAAELVVEILQYSENEIELREIEAESLYAGIMVDTKNFTFKTGVRTFEAAAYLRKSSIDILRVKKWFQSNLDSYKTIAEIVKSAEIIKGSIGISIYHQVDKDANLICAKAADELLTINNITASFVIGNMGDKICISGRSIGDINVQVILEKLGGGGHITLAGAQLEGITVEQAKEELIKQIEETLEQ